jgi:glycosyltransferase involved in cell wall biosynthesis
VSGGHDVADARLHRLANALVRRGLAVEVVGLGDPSGAPTGVAAVRTHPPRGLPRRLRDALALPWTAQGRVLVVIAPEMVPSAWVLRQVRRRRRLAVDVYEDYAKLAYDRQLGPARRRLAVAVVRLSTALTARADLTSVADAHVPPLRGRRRLVVRNVPDLTTLPAPTDREPNPRAVYIGDVRRSRGLVTMLTALEQAPDWTLDVVGPVAAADRSWLDEWLATSRAATRLRLHGRLPPARAWQIAAGAWIGLSLLDDTPAFREAVPSKLYEYAAVGLPSLATPLPRVVELLGESGAGVVVNNAAAAAAEMREFAADPGRLDTLRGRALAWAESLAAGGSPYDDWAAEVALLVEAKCIEEY